MPANTPQVVVDRPIGIKQLDADFLGRKSAIARNVARNRVIAARREPENQLDTVVDVGVQADSNAARARGHDWRQDRLRV